jgi:hypothetical protein
MLISSLTRRSNQTLIWITNIRMMPDLSRESKQAGTATETHRLSHLANHEPNSSSILVDPNKCCHLPQLHQSKRQTKHPRTKNAKIQCLSHTTGLYNLSSAPLHPNQHQHLQRKQSSQSPRKEKSRLPRRLHISRGRENRIFSNFLAANQRLTKTLLLACLSMSPDGQTYTLNLRS